MQFALTSAVPRGSAMTEENDKPDDFVLKVLHTVEDQQHRLMTPILQAYRRAQVALELLNGTIDAEKARAEVARVVALLTNIQGVLRGIKLYSRLAQGETIVLQPTRIDERKLLGILRNLGDDVNQLLPPDARVKVTSRVELEGQELVADLPLLQQVLVDLLDNAIKYSYGGTEIEITAVSQKSGEVLISIKNTGIPISRDDASNIFERGWRGDKARLVTGEGSGIGLWIAKSIMAAHGGQISVVPTANGEATIFQLSFPQTPRWPR